MYLFLLYAVYVLTIWIWFLNIFSCFFCILQDTCTWYFRLFILASAKSFGSSHVSCSCPPSTPVIFPFLSVRKLPKVGPLRGNTPTFISFV
jgi:hypothetical protein